MRGGRRAGRGSGRSRGARHAGDRLRDGVGIRHAGAAVVAIEERRAPGRERVARVHDPEAAEHHERVAVGVCRPEVIEIDGVGTAEHGHPVGVGAVGERVPEIAADADLGVEVERRERLVQHENARGAQDEPGEAQALALTVGECEPPAADDRRVTLGERLDERARLGERGGALDVRAARAGMAVAQVRLDRRVQQERLGAGVADRRSARGRSRAFRRKAFHEHDAGHLPAPDAPMSAMRSPGDTARATPASAAGLPGYANETSRSSTA